MCYATLVKETNLQMVSQSQQIIATSNSNINNSSSNLNRSAKSSKLDTFQKLIISTNNLERVGESLKLLQNEIETHSNSSAFNKTNSVDKQEKSKFIQNQKAQNELYIHGANEYLTQVAEQSIELIVENKVSFQYLN